MLKKLLSATLTITLLSLTFGSIPHSLAKGKKIVFNPPTSGAPKDTTGAATRDGQTCLNSSSQTTKQVVPILPPSNYGLTISSRPEYLIYKDKISAKQMLFSLKDENGEQIYQTFLELPSEAGIFNIKIPSESPELVVNKKYHWIMVFVCGKSLRPDSPNIEGWVQRIPKSQDLEAKLQSSSAFDRLIIYGEKGIWYDLVSDLNRLRLDSPGNQALLQDWESLLKSQNLKLS